MSTEKKYKQLLEKKNIRLKDLEEHEHYLQMHEDHAIDNLTKYSKLKRNNHESINKLKCKIRMLEEGMRIV